MSEGSNGAPLHPSKRLHYLFEKIADSSIDYAEIQYEGLNDEEAFDLAHALMQNESLKGLHLACSCARVSAGGLTQICQSLPCCLETLSLSRNPLTPPTVMGLTPFVQSNACCLTVLHLNDCNLQGEGLMALSKVLAAGGVTGLPLRVLGLNRNHFGDGIDHVVLDACAAFGNALSSLTCLEQLDIPNNKLNSRGFQAMQLHRIASLQKLCISCNKLDPSSGSALHEILISCTKLIELSLRSNELGSAGVTNMFQCHDQQQQHRYALEKLFLTSNLVSDTGVQDLAQQLRNGVTLANLKSLFLAHNDIGDEGAVALADALNYTSTNTNTNACTISLKVLDLNRNKIGNRGGLALAQAHRSNNTLHELILGYNRITETSVLKSVRFYGKVNAAGRYLLVHNNHNNVPAALWPLVLEKMNWQFPVRYYFVRHMPELFVHHEKVKAANH